MKVYINIYPPLPLGRREPVTRVFTDIEQAMYLRFDDCIGTYEIDIQTREAREIIPSPYNLTT